MTTATTADACGAYCRGCGQLVAIAKTSVGASRLADFQRVNAREDVRFLTMEQAHADLEAFGCACAEFRRIVEAARRAPDTEGGTT